jgi:DNA-binding IclR family transcriptional regulator
MEDLHTVIRHHIQLGVLDGHDVLFVERLSAHGAVINVTEVAGRLPLHASSSGLVLLAHGTPETRAAILDGPLRRFTASTITTPEQLRITLSEIRKTGYAYTPGHIRDAAAGVAVPIRDPDDNVIASLGVVVPNDETAARTVPALRAAAQGVQRAMAGA